MNLKSVLVLGRLLSHMTVAALGIAWVFPPIAQAGVGNSTESVEKTAPALLAPKIAANNTTDDDDVRDDNSGKRDREG